MWVAGYDAAAAADTEASIYAHYTSSWAGQAAAAAAAAARAPQAWCMDKGLFVLLAPAAGAAATSQGVSHLITRFSHYCLILN